MIMLLSRSYLPSPTGGDTALLARELDLHQRLRECLSNASQAKEDSHRLHWNSLAQEVQNQLNEVWDQLQAQAVEYADLRRPAPLVLEEGRRLLSINLDSRIE
jgi:hypothetical protein